MSDQPLVALLSEAGAEILEVSPLVVCRWRGSTLRLPPSTDPARVAELLAAAAALPDPLPTAEVALTRRDAAGVAPVFVPMISRDAARVLWELSGDSTYLYFDTEHSATIILGRDAAGGEIGVEYSMPRVDVGSHGGGPGRSASELRELVVESDASRATKRERLRGALACVRCDARAPLEDGDGDTLACAACGTGYPVRDGVPILLVDENATGEPDDGDVSSNTYSRQALALVDRFRDGLVLDCGCGHAERNLANVVNVEIVRYPNVDVVASADALPFLPRTFDGMICESVLEHVKDPWRVVDEIDRALRPNAAVLFDVPFIVPYHGYPNHYQNFTQSGLRHLLARFEEVSCGIQPHQEPWIAIGWILRLVREGLESDDLRGQLDQLSVGELLALVAQGAPPDPITRLDDWTRRAIAAGFTYYGHKRDDR